MADSTKQDQKPKSMNLPREVRDAIKREAKARGISASALGRLIMQEYVDGKLIVPGQPGAQIVSTSLWVDPELWSKFIAKSDKAGLSSQWIIRSWLDREGSLAA